MLVRVPKSNLELVWNLKGKGKHADKIATQNAKNISPR